MKTMRYWNGRCTAHDRFHLCIAAFTKASAVRLVKQALGDHAFSPNELNHYFAECWGTTAKAKLGDQTEEGVWLETWQNKFFKFVG